LVGTPVPFLRQIAFPSPDIFAPKGQTGNTIISAHKRLIKIAAGAPPPSFVFFVNLFFQLFFGGMTFPLREPPCLHPRSAPLFRYITRPPITRGHTFCSLPPFCLPHNCLSPHSAVDYHVAYPHVPPLLTKELLSAALFLVCPTL